MAKIVIDEKDLPDNATLLVVENMAKFFQAITDPYQMPAAMSDWLEQQNQSGVDTYQSMMIGYGYSQLNIRFQFKKSMIIMEFNDPTGMRLMELRLHK